MARRPLFVTPALALIVTFARPAEAAPWSLDWSAPRECPAQESVADAIRRLAPDSNAGDLAARVSVARADGDAWRAEVALTSGGETTHRSLESPSCAAIADAVAIVVSLALAPAMPPAAAAPPTVPAPRAPLSPISPASPGAPPRDVSRVDDHRALDGLSLEAGVVLDAGTLPSAGEGIRAGVGWRAPHVAVAVDGALFLPVHASVAASPSEGASFVLATASARGCLTVPLAGGTSRVIGEACAGVAIERIGASGFGAIHDLTPDAWTAAPLGDVAIAWWPSRWIGARMAARAIIPTSRPMFFVEGTGDLYRPAPVAWEPSIAVVVRFDK